MNEAEILEKVLAVFAANGINVESVTVDTMLGSPELELDSVVFMKVFIELENVFQIEIDYQDAVDQDSHTVGSLIDYLVERTTSQDK
ncbi:phosphopantetheine-binding protein [Paenibacillus sp.]|jgi:acyl carrier protein|uniref:acyl carrier protein n=1 Tax=Paenibacillus sp. TaxID=58172 RepID=UPI00281FA464|nr:phosphopantetheine-binding protein [Paenibacillus sp.]MDR0267481.1 phosphopantetheine-binding protein [Paenibacillus sp.]